MDRAILLKIFATISGISGIIILTGVLAPILFYQASPIKGNPDVVSPLPEKEVKGSIGEIDYTKASNWFVGGARSEDFSNEKIDFYTLSIPKLKIENATVAIGGEDLSKSLIQYPRTATPGKRGNSVIFGHSILPIFYNPKDYLAIFSTLPTLKKGDEINVNYDGIAYQFRVEDMFEVAPTDIQVLEQNSADSFLTLVTCVPPGDPRKPRRLIVRARVV
ncbi:sortase [Candidatus Woesebacteria bacterium]|nr:sortase [Candidatus Woesebacteria bacterium]